MSRRRVSWVISANIDNWQKNLNRAQKSMDRFSRNMRRMGRTMSTYVTAPIVAAGGASLKMASDFESSMSKIEGLVGIARSEVDRMKESVLGLSGETARAPQELAEAMFFITSAGNRGAQATELLEMAARGAAAGLGDTKDIAHLASSAIAAYGSENLNAAQAMDVLVGAVREGKAEASELATSMGMVLPIASEMGVSFDQVGAAVAAMTRTGTDAGTASMQLRQILASLIKPTNQAEQAMAEMGTSSAELRNTLREDGLVSILGFLREQMEENEQAMSQVFPNIRALSGALDIMGNNAEANVQIFEDVANSTGALDHAFDAASNTMRHQFDKALAGVRAEMIRFGNVMMPVATQVLEFVQRVIGNFSRMEDEMRKKIIVMAGLLGSAGPLMIAIGVAAKIITVFAGLVFTKFALIVATFVATVGAAQWFVNNWETLMDRLKHHWDRTVNDILYNAQLLARGIKWLAGEGTALGVALGVVDSRLEGLKRNVSRDFEKVMSSAANTLSLLSGETHLLGIDLDDVAPRFTGFGKAVGDVFKGMGDLVLGVTGADDAFNALMSLFDEAPAKMDETSDSAREVAERMNVVGRTFEGITQPVITATQVTTEGMDNVLEKTKQIAREGLSNWTKFVHDAKEAGFDFTMFLANEMTNALASLGETLGNTFAGVGNEWASSLQKALLVVTDFAKSLGRLFIAIGSAMMIIPGVQGNAARYIIGGTALVAAGTAGAAVIEKSADNNRATSVNDAIIRSDGSIVHLNPQDDILAMKDFGNLSKKVQIFPVLELDGRTVWEAQKAYEVDL